MSKKVYNNNNNARVGEIITTTVQLWVLYRHWFCIKKFGNSLLKIKLP